jgi:hypothetical protein
MLKSLKVSSALAALLAAQIVHAQMGAGWSVDTANKKIQLQNENVDSQYVNAVYTYPYSDAYVEYTRTNGVLKGSYDYEDSTMTEIFKHIGGPGVACNRVEYRNEGNYGSGTTRQLEAYVTFNGNLNSNAGGGTSERGQSLMQIWGYDGGQATRLQVRGSSDNGGELSFVNVTAVNTPPAFTGLNNKEFKLNVIHVQETRSGTTVVTPGRIRVWVNGELYIDAVDNHIADASSLGDGENYMKYGLYGTMESPFSNPEVVFKEARFYKDGALPGSTAQTITFPALPSPVYVGSADIPLQATTSASGLTVRYRSSNTNVATIVGNAVRIVGTGTTQIWAMQDGNGTYAPAKCEVQTLTVTNPPATSDWFYNGPQTFTGTNFVSGGTAGNSSSLTVAFFATAGQLASMGPVDKLPASGSNAGWAVKLRSNGDLWFRLGTELAKTDTVVAGAYALNTRVHIACTYSGGTARVYVNGVLRTTTTGLSYAINNNATQLRLGIPSVAATTNAYVGVLEDVRVYDNVLSAGEIATLAAYPTWRFDGPQSFDGTNFVSGGTAGNSSSLTVAFFATAGQLARMGPVDKLPASGSNAGWAVKLRSNGDLWFRLGTELAKTDTVVTGAYALNTPVHVACTYSGGVARVYIDGVLRATSPTLSYTINNNATQLRLGIPSVAATTNVFVGALQNVKIYPQALTQAQISELAQGL